MKQILKKRLPVLLSVTGVHLLFWAILMLCGGNILVGILAILGYRATLWSSPLVFAAVCYFPSRIHTLRSRLYLHLTTLLPNLCLFLLCRASTGNWF